MQKKTQVLIVGAGPTGLTMAADLERFGIDFIIIDKKDGITDLSKALGVQARTLEVFEEYGLADEAVKRGEKAKAGEIIVNGKQRGLLNLTGLGKGLTAFPYLLILPQSETEELLEGHLKKKRKKILWKHELLSLQQDKKSATATIKSPKGTQSIKADYIVGCDGAGSFVRKHLKMKFEGDTAGQLFYVVDAKVDWKLKNKEHLKIFFSRNNFILYFPLKGGNRFRVISKLEGYNTDRSPNQISYEEIEADILNDTSVPVRILDVAWHSVYKVHSRKAKTFRKGRVFLAGDAAHIHTPAGGQGMNTGIQDAYNLGWKLAMVLQGKLKPSILDTYDQEREVNARNLLKGTDRAFKYMSSTGPFYAFLRIYILPYLLAFLSQFTLFSKKAFLTISEIDIQYKSQAILPSSYKTIEAGKRLPYIDIKGSSIYNMLRGQCFYLLHGHEQDLAQVSLPKWVKRLAMDPKHLKLDGHFVLLRPDKHVAYVGKDLSKIQALLHQMSCKTA